MRRSKVLVISTAILIMIFSACATIPDTDPISLVPVPEEISVDAETTAVPEAVEVETDKEPEIVQPEQEAVDQSTPEEELPVIVEEIITEVVEVVEVVEVEIDSAEAASPVVPEPEIIVTPEEVLSVEPVIPEEPTPITPIQYEPETTVVSFIVTTDIHGKFFPYDYIQETESPGSLAQIYTYLKDKRAKGDEIILLDNGNILQGQPLVYYYNFVKTDSIHIAAEVMNTIKYDAVSPGLHDIETGHGVYDKIRSEFSFPWLAANAVHEESGRPYFEPYTIIERNGIRAAVLGLITPDIPSWLPSDVWEGIKFDDPIITAAAWIDYIERNENPDIIIGMYQPGFSVSETDPGEIEYHDQEILKLAEQVPGFDIIFSGNNSKPMNTVVQNAEGENVYLLGAMSNGVSISSVDVHFTRKTEKSPLTIEAINPSIIKTENLEADPGALQMYQDVSDEIESYIAKKIGTISSTVSASSTLLGDNEFMDFIHQLQLDLTGADVSFASPPFADAEIKEGEVFVGDMFNLFPSENLLYAIEMTGAEIDAYLEYSYAGWFSHLFDEDGRLLTGTEVVMDDIPYYNFDSAAGLEYVVDVSKPDGDRVTITGVQGIRKTQPLKMDKVYLVAVNSYRGNGGGGHLTEGAGIPRAELRERVLYSTLQDLRFYAIRLFEYSGTIIPFSDENWKIVPDGWNSNAD